MSLSISFRTLKTTGVLVDIREDSANSFTRLEIDNGGYIIYRSSSSNKPEINMTASEVNVADGQWHTVELIKVKDPSDSSGLGRTLSLLVDGYKSGYDLEFSAAHNFFGSDVTQFVVGDASSVDRGFRGCLANFTLNGNLISLGDEDEDALLEVNYLPSGLHTGGCDIAILESVQAKNAVDIGVIVVIIFFVFLICGICVSFSFFKLRRKWAREAEALQNQQPPNNKVNLKNNEVQQQQSSSYGGVYTGTETQQGYTNQAMEGEPRLNNQPSFTVKQKMKRPEQLTTRDYVNPSPMVNNDYNNPMRTDLEDHQGGSVSPVYQSPEHYDLENASSIAPSDIDIVYHYKGYRDGNTRPDGGHGDRSHGSKGRYSGRKSRNRHQSYLKNTPLARLSPSSEMSHQTPRILTLGDLSGKPLPPTLLAEQSERSLNSPISHISSASAGRHSHHMKQGSGGLTSENVARFNKQHANSSTPRSNGTPTNQNPVIQDQSLKQDQPPPPAMPLQKSSLINTLDLVNNHHRNQTPTSLGGRSSAVSQGQRHPTSRGNSRAAMNAARRTPGLGSSDTSDSSSDDDRLHEDDSFTCSEYEDDNDPNYEKPPGSNKDQSEDQLNKGDISLGAMVFSKLMKDEENPYECSDDEHDDDLLGNPPPPPPRLTNSPPLPNSGAFLESKTSKTWESLLSWIPDYNTFSGVFRYG